MNAVVATRSPNIQLGELDTIEKHLKKAGDDNALRRVCVELNQFREHLRDEAMEVRARYSFLRGMLYAKVGSATNGPGFLGSSVECLHYAIDQFADAEEALQRCVTDMLRLPGDLAILRRVNAYEAAAVLTRLKVWGYPLGNLTSLPDTNHLDATQQRKVQRALSACYILPSRF